MKRRQLIVLAAGAIGSSLTIGSGAFSSSRAERSVTAKVADDDEAYLRIDTQPVGIAGRSNQVNLGDDGRIATFRIPGPEEDLVEGTDPSGVGTESEYWFESMAVIQNQGNQPVTVYSEYDGNIDKISIFSGENNKSLLTSPESGKELNVGESFTMGIYIKTGEGESTEYTESIGISAQAVHN